MDKPENLWLVILGGSFPVLLQKYCSDESIMKLIKGVICADSGANHTFVLKMIPQVIVGDGDSILPEALEFYKKQNVEFVDYDAAKDFTDGEAALQEALKRGADNVWIFGACGGRLDHQLANIQLAGAYVSYWKDLLLFGDDFLASFILGEDEREIQGRIDDTVSLIPLSDEVKGITLQGFAYPLTDKDICFGPSLTMSNKIVSLPAKIIQKQGLLMVIHYGRLL